MINVYYICVIYKWSIIQWYKAELLAQRTRVRFPTWALEIAEIIFVVFPAYPTVWTVYVSGYGDMKLCLGAIHRVH